MRQFNHPHILQIHAAFTANNNGAGELHVVMPLMCFGSCRDMLNNFFITGFPEPIVALLLRDALIGLDYLHRRGVVHRALRASHILVNRSRALLCGFRDCVSLVAHGERVRTLHELPGSRSSGGGATANNTARTSGAAALPLASKAAAASTSAANPSKHLNWLAPEVLEQNVLGYTEKADVYSVGIMTCELANSLEPFADMPTTFMLTEKIRGNTPALLDCSTCPPPIGNPRLAFNLWKTLCVTFNAISDSVVGDSLAETRQIYGTRALSDNFHKFAEICMSRYPVERPTVAQLLGHAFFKQNKQTSLYEQLQLTGAEILDCTKIKGMLMKKRGVFFLFCFKTISLLRRKRSAEL